MLLEPVVPWGGMFVLHGPRASGKTQLALALAAAAASGSAFLGVWKATKARVLFLECDTPAVTLHERVAVAQQAALSEVAFLTFDSPINILAIAERAAAVAPLVEARRFGPELVVIDSLRKTHPLDENDSSTPSRVYAAFRTIFPAATLGFLHHDRKVAIGPLAGDTDEAFRGSSAWLDDVDTGIHLVRDKRAKEGLRAILSFSKVRTSETPTPTAIKLAKGTLWPELADAPPRLALLAHLEAHPEDRSKERAVRWLEEQKICSRRTAYNIADELGLS